MNDAIDNPIVHLYQQREELLAQWLHALLATGFASVSNTAVHRQLAVLLNQFFDLLLSEPPAPMAAAQAIGATLANLHLLQDETLAITYQVLGSEILALVPSHAHAWLSARLIPIMGAIATGWAQQTRQRILTEQERVRCALQQEQERVETELRQSENRLRTVITSAPVVLFAIDRDGYITLAEGRSLQRLPDIMVKSKQSIFDNPPHPQVPSYVHRALTGETVLARVPINGIIFETCYAPLTNGDTEIIGVIGVSIDITEQIQAETELAWMRRRLAERVEQEQQRIARELHDDTVQRLVAIGYTITNELRRVDQQVNEADQALHLALVIERVRTDILTTVDMLRVIVNDLRPPGLDELGLSAALTGYVQKLQASSANRPHINLDVETFPVGSLPPATVLTFFRCAQEAVRNALRHSQAQHITVRLQKQDETLVLQVEDDGCGFAVPENLYTFVRDNHFGLVGLAERTASEGGTLILYSHPAAGTNVTITLPYCSAVTADA